MGQTALSLMVLHVAYDTILEELRILPLSFQLNHIILSLIGSGGQL
jgi:hypothetical protein